MITEKQKCIAEQAVYGDLIGYDLRDTYYCKHPSTIVGFQGQLVYIGCDLNKVEAIKPILRPLSDLTKEITHKGYNDDKPSIPLVELAKITMQEALRKEYWKPEQFILNGDNVELGDYRFFYEKQDCFSWRNKFADFQKITPLYQQSIYDLLHLWHFDTRNLIEKGEAIDVNTLSINPYSADYDTD